MSCCRLVRHAGVAAVGLHLATVCAAAPAPPGKPVWPGRAWARAAPADVGMDHAKLEQARDYALTGGGSGYVTRGGWLVLSWGDPRHRYDLKSSTKSIGITALGLAIQDGKIGLDDPAHKHHPTLGTPPDSNAATGWLDKITIRHLATQTAGFEKPGGYTRLVFAPGTAWAYSDGGPNWLAECITRAYGKDLRTLMFDRVFTPLGITPQDLTWRKNAYRDRTIDGIPRREFGSGISANVDAMARIGCLYLRGGRWKDETILGRDFVDAARTTVPGAAGLPVRKREDYSNASDHYGLLWWNNADGTLPNVPRDAYWSWGLYDSLIVVIPSLDLVVARAGKSWERKGGGHYAVLAPFLDPIVASVHDGRAQAAGAPYPPSPVIAGVDWAPVDTITRKAVGSDNWPITWADDGELYTAYGDGWGFTPRTERKLSQGFARIHGPADSFRGVNIRSPTGERTGDGAKGAKASGLLMVDGVLYLWVRNTGNATLAWSADHARTWTWGLRFATSFGCPTFLECGRDYDGAPDGFVYTYSSDGPSAYASYDRIVLARVPRERITDRNAYAFFHGLDERGQPQWTADLEARGAVFSYPRHCQRVDVVYHTGLRRYLMCLSFDHGGAWGIFDAPAPWGPWTTAFSTDDWGLGGTHGYRLPTKWIDPSDGTFHLVFSGRDDYDAFCVRQGRLRKSRIEN